MGLFDKLKQAANFVTGNSAIVNIRTESPVNSKSAPIKFIIDAQTKDSSVNVRNVYLKIRSVEQVEVLDSDTHTDEDGKTHRSSEVVRESETVFSIDLQVSGSEELAPNSSHSWEFEYNIPSSENPTYRGRKAQHIWQMYAGLDTAGNDPDSGWNTFEVSC
ncbi:MAG: hypothetical protein AAGI25_21095 [Bacteroidota bacterium]